MIQCQAENKAELEYKLKIGHANFTIIDTPGFGDSRGIAQDQINFERIR